MVQSQIEEVDRRIGDLEAMRAQLSGMLAACGGRRIGDCGVVESLANRPPAN